MGAASYFVPDPDLLVRGRSMPYDLYINSSAVPGRDHYVRVFPRGDTLSDEDLRQIREKYTQVYVSEDQRALYLKAACELLGKTEHEKVVILKTSAIHHLDHIFDTKRELSSDIINSTLVGCRQTVEGFVSMLKGYDLSKLHELIGSLSFHDFYTYDHSINVSMYNILIYQLLHPDASEDDAINAGMGGFLHDIGKIRIPNRILNKVGKLSDDEFSEIKRHPGYGKDYLSAPGVKGPPGAKLELIQSIVFQHHENYDGSGYPARLSGAEIHELARITAIADFFDAVTTHRSYSEALPVDEAIGLMKKARGKKLDPNFFDRFALHMRDKYGEKYIGPELSAEFDPCQPHVKLKREDEEE